MTYFWDAEFIYALEKWKGRLPPYLDNEGLYQKTVTGRPPNLGCHHILATNAQIKKP